MDKSLPGLILVVAFAGLFACTDSPPKLTDWQSKIAQQDISQEAFAQACLAALIEMHPAARVEQLEPMVYSIRIDDFEIRSFLENAWNDTKNHPNDRAERCVGQWAGIEQMAAKDESHSISYADIVPMIKDIQYLENAQRITGKDNHLYHEPLVADFIVVYAEDSEFQLAYLTQSDVKELGLSTIALRDLAITNMDQKLTEIKRHGDGPTYMLTAGGNFEASMLLIDEIWADQSGLVEGNLVVAAPARDMLVFTGSGSAEGIKQLQNMIDAVFKDGSYLISQTLLVRRDGQWYEFTE